MLDEELRESEFPKIWDNTLRSTANACKRKFYWFMRGYDYGDTPPYFVWGAAFQEILNSWYSNQGYKKSLRAGLDYYDLHISTEDKPDTKNSKQNLERIFEHYANAYPEEPWNMVEGGAEIGWIWPIKHTDFMLGGSLDGYIEWPSYGKLIFETKTTGEYLSQGFLSSWQFSSQVTGYIWYLTELLGQEIFGCLMNLVTKNFPGPRSNWTTPRLQRVLIRKTPEQLEEFINDFLWDITDVMRCWNSWTWPKTTDHTMCAGGAGKAPCLFRRICQHDKSHYSKLDPAAIPGIKLREGPWQPWERKGDQL